VNFWGPKERRVQAVVKGSAGQALQWEEAVTERAIPSGPLRVQVREFPLKETLKAPWTVPGWNVVGWPRPAGVGEKAFLEPTGMLTVSLASLS
jgi:hypothetical protein